MSYRRYRVVIEVNVPDNDSPASFLDEFNPVVWGSALLEAAYARTGGPKAHPYTPRVVEGYEVTGISHDETTRQSVRTKGK